MSHTPYAHGKHQSHKCRCAPTWEEADYLCLKCGALYAMGEDTFKAPLCVDCGHRGPYRRLARVKETPVTYLSKGN